MPAPWETKKVSTPPWETKQPEVKKVDSPPWETEKVSTAPWETKEKSTAPWDQPKPKYKIEDEPFVIGEKSWLEKAIAGLDYLGNVSRTGIKSGFNEFKDSKNNNFLSDIGQAFVNKKYTSPEELKDTMTKGLGLGKLRIGADDGKFQMGDVGDFTADLFIDIATDPLTYLSFGFNKLAKYGTKAAIKASGSGAKLGRLATLGYGADSFSKVAKTKRAKAALNLTDETFDVLDKSSALMKDERTALRGLSEATRELGRAGIKDKKTIREILTHSPDALRAAKNYKKSRAAIATGLGAMFGVAAADPNGTYVDNAMSVGLGAASFFGMRAGADHVSGLLKGRLDPKTGNFQKGALDELTDSYYKYTRKIGVNLTDKEIKKIAFDQTERKFTDAVKKGYEKEGKIKFWDEDKALYREKIEQLYKKDMKISASEADYMATEAMDKVNHIKDGLRSNYSGFVASLPKDADRVAVTNIMRKHKDHFAARRLEEFEKIKNAKDGFDLSDKAIYASKKELAHDIEQKIQDEMFAEGGVVAKDLDDLASNQQKAYYKWIENNAETIKLYNEMTGENVKGIPWHMPDLKVADSIKVKEIVQANGADSFKKGMLHMYKGEISGNDSLRLIMGKPTQEEAIEISKMNKDIKRLMDAGRKSEANQLIHKVDAIKNKAFLAGEDVNYEAYVNKMSSKFLSAKENEALVMLNSIKSIDPVQPFWQTWEKGLDLFDGMTSFMKQNMLLFTPTWLRTNYFDNLMKSYHQNGIITALDTASIGSFRKIRSDISKVVKGEIDFNKLKHPEIKGALERGVTERGMFDMVNDPNAKIQYDQMQALIKSPNAYRTMISNEMIDKYGKTQPEAIAAFFGSAGKWWTDKLSKSTGYVGTLMEGTARMSTYINTVELLSKDKSFYKELIESSKDFLRGSGIRGSKLEVGAKEMAEKRVRDIAAQTTKDTFFDYGKLSLFEKKFAKRLLPFYAFYSKNLPYWINSTLDPKRLAATAQIDKVRKNIGRDFTPEERKGMQDYIINNAGRVLGVDEATGSTKVALLPYMALYDAAFMMNPFKAPKQVWEKTHPYIKLFGEIIQGRDYFAGTPLLPSQMEQKVGDRIDKEGKKFLYSRGFKYILAERILKKAGMTMADLGVELDKNGNPVTTSDTIVYFDKVVSTLLPHGVIDKIAGNWNKAEYKKRSFVDLAAQLVAPTVITEVSEGSQGFMKYKRNQMKKLGIYGD